MDVTAKDRYTRTEMLLGPEGLSRLAAARVAVFGIGGVGGYAVEALARSGVGAIDLFDPDAVSPSNLNRQIIATNATLGRLKVDAMAERIHDIAPECRVERHPVFYLPENAAQFDLTVYDWILDAVDTVAAKLELAVRAQAAGVPIISAMGAGNKLDPTMLRVADISVTTVCPLARIMRRELRKKGILHLRAVFSTEPPLKPAAGREGNSPAEHAGPSRRDIPGSCAFVPAAMGMIMAAEAVRGIALAQAGVSP